MSHRVNKSKQFLRIFSRIRIRVLIMSGFQRSLRLRAEISKEKSYFYARVVSAIKMISKKKYFGWFYRWRRLAGDGIGEVAASERPDSECWDTFFRAEVRRTDSFELSSTWISFLLDLLTPTLEAWKNKIMLLFCLFGTPCGRHLFDHLLRLIVIRSSNVNITLWMSSTVNI